MLLSSSPFSEIFFSCPYSNHTVSHLCLFLLTWRRHVVGSKRTVPRKQGGLEAASLADEDRGMRVVLLHGGIAALEEVPTTSNISPLALPIPSPHLVLRRRRIAILRAGVVAADIPCRSAVLASLAEEKPQLLKSRAECILRRHRVSYQSGCWKCNW